jgi:hypothetical protein
MALSNYVGRVELRRRRVSLKDALEDASLEDASLEDALRIGRSRDRLALQLIPDICNHLADRV